MDAVVRYAGGGLAFLARASTGHWLAMDTKVGEQPPAASSPKELALMAVGGCTGMDVIAYLQKRRLEVRGFEVALTAQASEEHPRVFTRIDLTYRVRGQVPVADLQRAITLSQTKYCSVSAMMRKNCPIHWTAEVDGEKVLEGGDEAATGAPAAAGG